MPPLARNPLSSESSRAASVSLDEKEHSTIVSSRLDLAHRRGGLGTVDIHIETRYLTKVFYVMGETVVNGFEGGLDLIGNMGHKGPAPVEEQRRRRRQVR